VIAYDDFLRVDVRAGTILAVEPLPKARKPAFALRIDFGEELGERRSSAQITGRYNAAELDRHAGLRGGQLSAQAHRRFRERGARARDGRRGRQRRPGAADLPRPQRPAVVLMTATAAGLEIRVLEREGERPS
jgi:hypothetical protein